MQRAILGVLDSANLRLSVLDRTNIGGLERVAFTVNATRSTHERLLKELRASDATDQVVTFAGEEED
jgi:putative Mg2+ transporter-C (MgtC) family protein